MKLDEYGRWCDTTDEYGGYVATVTSRGRWLFRYPEFVEAIASLDACARSKAVTLYHATVDFTFRARAWSLTAMRRNATFSFVARLLHINLYTHKDNASTTSRDTWT